MTCNIQLVLKLPAMFDFRRWMIYVKLIRYTTKLHFVNWSLWKIGCLKFSARLHELILIKLIYSREEKVLELNDVVELEGNLSFKET